MDLARVRIGYIAAVLLYGTVGLVERYINLPSEVIVFFRGALGTLSVLMYMFARGRRPDGAAIRSNLRWLIAGGICLGLNWVFLFILCYIEPVTSVLCSAFILHGPLEVAGAIGAVLVIAAAAVVGETVRD